MRRFAPVAVALVLVVAAGAAHGIWSGRWSTSDPLAEPLARLTTLPAAFGSWKSDNLELEERERKIGGIAGYVLRRYRRADGEQVTLFVVCGKPGPISVHTPDVCYEGTGFTRKGDIRETQCENAAFHEADFRETNNPVPARLRVVWSWSADGTWRAPKNPRWTFARAPALYKMYVIHRTFRPDDPTPIPEFLKEFLPELQRALFAD